MEDRIKKFYQEEKDRLDEFIRYNETRDKGLYSEEEMEKFNDYIRHSKDWLRKIKRVIDGEYIFNEE